jgi:hypothetical protein
MDVDLSRAGGMSRLLRQGKASEHTLHCSGLRWVLLPFFTRYKGPSQWLSRTAERLPMCPRTSKQEAGIRVRLRMFRRSTHAAFRARSFLCSHSPPLARRLPCPANSRHCKLDK